MPMLLIEGDYRPLHTEPDGDSLRFYPRDPSQWKLLPGPHQVRPNTKGGAQMRFDGIDALETHYPTSGGFGIVHQPLTFGHKAAQEVLHWLGFTHVVRAADETVTAVQPQQIPGYILSRTADKYGRCVAFIFKGKAPAASGTFIHFGIAELHKSLNYHLLNLGLAYPTYYTKLYPDIRTEMTKAVHAARQGKGLWPADVTNAGFVLQGAQTVFETAVILPKLFRRLMDYLAINDDDDSLAGFLPYLAARDDRMFILSTGHSTGFDFVVEVTGQNLKLTRPPEDLVFVEG
jgi:endonuclease YncB( thermonuclease family)